MNTIQSAHIHTLLTHHQLLKQLTDTGGGLWLGC